MWKKVALWTLVILAYASEFATPLVSAYFLFARKTVSQESIGGITFFAITAIVLIIFYKKFMNVLNKQKAGFIKLTVKLGINSIILYFVQSFIMQVGASSGAIVKFLYITIMGLVGGYVIKLIALYIDKAYIKEIEVF